ncbi:hypothetical protein D3C76_1364570 [compost metagenome]
MCKLFSFQYGFIGRGPFNVLYGAQVYSVSIAKVKLNIFGSYYFVFVAGCVLKNRYFISAVALLQREGFCRLGSIQVVSVAVTALGDHNFDAFVSRYIIGYCNNALIELGSIQPA